MSSNINRLTIIVPQLSPASNLTRAGLTSVCTALSLLIAACGGGGGGTAEPNASQTSSIAAVDPAPTGADDPALSAAPSISTTLETESKSPVGLTNAVAEADVQPESAIQEAAADETANALAASVADGTTSTSTAGIVYVSPVGNDLWSGGLAVANAGNTDGPVKSLARAQAIVRSSLAAMNAGTTARRAMRVVIAAGQYRLTAPLQFSTADSGTVDAPVSYEAAVAGTVLISGGQTVIQNSGAAGSAIRFDAAFDTNAVTGGGQLYVGGRRAVLARQPNQEAAWFVNTKLVLASEPADQPGREAFAPTASALTWLNGLSASDRSRAIVNIMQSWSSGHHRFNDSEVPAGAVRVKPRAARAFLNYGPSQRYFIENVASALDAQREWLPTAAGAMYIPAADEANKSLTAVIPVLDKLITIKGDFAATRWVSHLQFKGLNFAHTRGLIPVGGAVDTQAGNDVSAAIEADGAQFLLFDNCNVSQTGGYAIWFRRAVRDSIIKNSTFSDLGAGGLKLGQVLQSLTDAMKTGNNTATGNRISDTGKLYPGSVGIWLGQTWDTKVTNNAISNTTYTGISVGWTWGYDPATSGRNTISNNLLVNIGQAQLSDLGGIYTVGISPGTVISGNVIREVRAYPGYGPGAWGLYNDEGASDTLMQNNIVIGTDSGGYHLNFGRNNVLKQNLFARGGNAEMRVARTDPTVTKLNVANNLMLPSVRQPFDSFAMAPDALFAGNPVSATESTAGLDLAKCGAGCGRVDFRLTTTSDPRIITLTGLDAATTDRLQQTAATAGPVAVAGTPEVVIPPVAPPPPVPVAPPTGLTIDITNATIGTQPSGLQYLPKGNTAAIGVVANSRVPGGKCLAFNDSAAFRYAYEPYTYTTLNHATGTSTVELGLIIDAASSFNVEWRDLGNPYKSGPAMQLTQAGIKVKGRIVAPVPIGEYFTLTATAPVDNPTGTWTLQVKNSAGSVTHTINNLAFGTTGWTKFNWFGLISDTATTSTVCVGKLAITNVSP